VCSGLGFDSVERGLRDLGIRCLRFMHGLPEVCNVDDEGEKDDSLEAGNYSNDPPQVSARVNVPVPVCEDREFRV